MTIAEKLLAEWSERTGIAVEVWTRMAGEPGADGMREALGAVLAAVEEGTPPPAVCVALTTGVSGARLTVSHDDVGESWPVERLKAVKEAFRRAGGRVSVNGVAGGGVTVSGVLPRSVLKG
ncbi:hypothetical protein [Nonomuraea soli]|uniref:Uncharacterized protein n=1 Tax=Nonomuraea soli TaxID=1032476 RepID=A0A7W0CQ89_9ACTN|nr:hypothetical protein [Nonomuraea soli]MBA2895287.1 hypothetical protein [Nonomuraea soli]